MERIEELLHQTNHWRARIDETIMNMGVAAFRDQKAVYAVLKGDLETYLSYLYRFNRKLANASANATVGLE